MSGQWRTNLTMVRSEVPQSDSLVHGAGEESVISRVHGEGDNLLVVATKVADVLVFLEGHVPTNIEDCFLYFFLQKMEKIINRTKMQLNALKS